MTSVSKSYLPLKTCCFFFAVIFVSKVLPDRNSSFSWIYSLPSINKQSINQQLPRWAKIPFWGEDQIEGDRCPIEPIRKILITAMGRSGSSFVGQILTTMVSQSYYAFEPLWDSGGNITEGTFNKSTDLVYRILKAHFDCQVAQNMSSLIYYHHFCRSAIRRQRFTNCKAFFENMCPQAKLRVAKSMINMPCMEGQPEIVDDIENLALQNSFGRRKKNKTFRRLGRMVSFPVPSVDFVCEKQLSIIDAAMQAADYLQCPSRIKFMKYEEVMQDPVEVMQSFSQEVFNKPLSVRTKMVLQNTDEENNEKYEADDGRRRKIFLQTASAANSSKICQKLFDIAQYDFGENL